MFIYDLKSERKIKHEGMDDFASNIEYEYKMNEFRVDSKEITQDMIMANPQEYINYIPEKDKSVEDVINELKEQNDMLTQCVLEMSEMVYQ